MAHLRPLSSSLTVQIDPFPFAGFTPPVTATINNPNTLTPRPHGDTSPRQHLPHRPGGGRDDPVGLFPAQA